MRVLLIVNAAASSVTPRGRVVIQKALSADHEVTVGETSRRGHATRLAQGAAREGLDAVVVLGGDGTLNEAANGLAGSTTALGVLPGGSTNVFARTLGLTNDPIEATGELLGAMARDARRRIGLGSVNGRYFLFHAGIGFDAAVVEQVEKRGQLKRWAGHPLFVFAAFSTWFRHYDRSGPRFDVTIDAPTAEPAVPSFFTLCMNTNPYTYLGERPLNVAPEATFDRGLAVVSFRNLRFDTIVGVGLSTLGTGRRVQRMRSLARTIDVTQATITGRGPFPYQVDGDYLGETESLVLRHHPTALDIFMPRPDTTDAADATDAPVTPSSS